MRVFNEIDAELKPVCDTVDKVLAQYSLQTHIIGGVITERGLFLFLSRHTLYVPEDICEAIRHALAAEAVKRSPGQLFVQIILDGVHDEEQTAVADENPLLALLALPIGDERAVYEEGDPTPVEETQTQETAVSEVDTIPGLEMADDEDDMPALPNQGPLFIAPTSNTAVPAETDNGNQWAHSRLKGDIDANI